MNGTPKKYWTKENCIESAANYNSITDWRRNESGAYVAAMRNGWLNECKDFLNTLLTKDKCIESAVKYKRKANWSKRKPKEYKIACINGWIDECTSHMGLLKKSEFYWTKEKCIESALEYNRRNEWRHKKPLAYKIARKNGWFDECTAHMRKLKKSEFYWTKEKCIESALEYNRRNEWRHEKPLAYKTARKNNWLEECTAHMEKLKKSEFYWTKEKCIECALEYNRRTNWMQKSPLAYKTARKNNWLEECTAHMENLRKMKSYWTKEKCIESAMNYKRKYEWRKKEKGAYYAARENNWFEECVEHMVKDLKWTKEKCIASAVKFNTKTDWNNSESQAYAAARKYKWLTECTAHMICKRKANKNWTKEKCFESAKNYALSRDWAKCNKGAYETARRNGWLPECNAHLKRDSLTKRMEISISSSS